MNIDKYIQKPIPIKKQLLQLFAPADSITIFDIGACEGEDSIRYSMLFPNATIIAFEPVPDNIKKIDQNIKKHGVKNIRIAPFALSNYAGTAAFQASSGQPFEHSNQWNYGNKSGSLLKPASMLFEKHSWLKFEQNIEVECNTIENYCTQANIEQIDFIHLDVQGAELNVLQGAGKYLSRIKAIWLEVENVELYENQPLANDVEFYMTNAGFVKILDKVHKVSGDQLYVHKSVAFKFEKGNNWIIRKLIAWYNRLKQPNSRTSYAQAGEDLLIQFVLNALRIYRPAYLDIGAHEPIFLSNTYYFYKKGNFGVSIEPDTYLFKSFKKKRKRDICLNIGVGISSLKEADLYILTNRTLNTFSKTEALNYEKVNGIKIEKVIKIPLVNINEVIADYFPKCPNFISIDVEGLDFEIVKSFDFEKYRPEVFCIETINFTNNNTETKNTQIIEFMKQKGYMIFADTYINTIFVEESKWRNR